MLGLCLSVPVAAVCLDSGEHQEGSCLRGNPLCQPQHCSSLKELFCLSALAALVLIPSFQRGQRGLAGAEGLKGSYDKDVIAYQAQGQS